MESDPIEFSRSEPGLVGGWSVDRRHLSAGHTEIHAQLAAVVNLVGEHEPEELHLRQVAHRLRRREERHRARKLVVARGGKPRGHVGVRLHEGVDHLLPRFRRGWKPPPSLSWSFSAARMSRSSMANVHTRWRAVLERGWGLKSPWSAG